MQTVISMILIAWGQNMILFVAFRVKATFALECRGVGSLALPAILWHLQLHAKRQGCRDDGGVHYFIQKPLRVFVLPYR